MKIIQIILGGSIPPHLKSCVDSVILYSHKNNIEYEQINDYRDYLDEPKFLSSKDRFIFYRHCSDLIRTKYLSMYENIWYIDWDMFIYPDIKINDITKQCWSQDIDSMFYNGSNLKIFKDINDKLNKPSFNNNYNLSLLIRDYLKNNSEQQYFVGKYCHFCNCRFKNCYDLY